MSPLLLFDAHYCQMFWNNIVLVVGRVDLFEAFLPRGLPSLPSFILYTGKSACTQTKPMGSDGTVGMSHLFLSGNADENSETPIRKSDGIALSGAMENIAKKLHFPWGYFPRVRPWNWRISESQYTQCILASISPRIVNKCSPQGFEFCNFATAFMQKPKTILSKIKLGTLGSWRLTMIHRRLHSLGFTSLPNGVLKNPSLVFANIFNR